MFMKEKMVYLVIIFLLKAESLDLEVVKFLQQMTKLVHEAQ